MIKSISLLLFTAMAAALSLQGKLVAHYDMTLHNGQIRETVTGSAFDVLGHFAPEDVAGVKGQALRFDGYTSHVKAALGDVLPAAATSMTLSVWMAVPSYPVIQLDTDTPEQTAVVSCLNDEAKTGMGLFLGFDGKYSFRAFIGGWPVNIQVDEPLPTYAWCCITAVLDDATHTLRLYNNGVEVGSARANGALSFSAGDLYMGQGTASRMHGPFELMSFNGLIDDISLWDTAMAPSEIQQWTSADVPDLDIPASRFSDDVLRPHYHAMPAAGWTNECHGLYYSDGRYHLFFQKNADGPYMARLHWGHISSADLCHWREERIALAPGQWYDIKGCWSGCVFADDIVTSGQPSILYTAVDYSKAMIAQASPMSTALDKWVKSSANPVIPGHPAGLSDDFRDPYFFRSGDQAYMIIGTSKDGVGAVTLHRYITASGTWTNTGDIFFAGTSTAADGTFWEMPTITPMPGTDRWLFTATPLGTSQGVRTLYWTGAIDNTGHFVADNAGAKTLELNARDGYGLLSPTIYNTGDGRTVALGIVPDKLSAQDNWELGWAHCYSLPRLISLDSDGTTLVQKPYPGLESLRSAEAHYLRTDFTLDGTLALDGVQGRQAEVKARFRVGDATVGVRLLCSGSKSAVISYNPATGTLTADFSSLQRLVNDGDIYDGIYTMTLPQRPGAGDEMMLDIYLDGSILDIFVNDRYAQSLRVFATDPGATGVEAFATSPTACTSLEAWQLDASDGSGLRDAVTGPCDAISEPVYYDLQGCQTDHPRAGNIYLLRQGGNAAKIRF